MGGMAPKRPEIDKGNENGFTHLTFPLVSYFFTGIIQ